MTLPSSCRFFSDLVTLERRHQRPVFIHAVITILCDQLSGRHAAQLIAKDRDDRMDENWTLMSAFEKDEIAEESSRGR